MNKLHETLKRPAVAALIRERVTTQFKEGREINDEFLDALAAELDALKEWKNPTLEAVDGKIYRILLGGAAAILWTLLQSGVTISGPRKLKPRQTAR